LREIGIAFSHLHLAAVHKGFTQREPAGIPALRGLAATAAAAASPTTATRGPGYLQAVAAIIEQRWPGRLDEAFVHCAKKSP
jgi:hypothetical protein